MVSCRRIFALRGGFYKETLAVSDDRYGSSTTDRYTVCDRGMSAVPLESGQTADHLGASAL